MDKYTKEYQNQEKINEYASTFRKKPDKMISDLEQDIVQSVFEVASNRDAYLDIACGFGRITNPVSKLFNKSFAIDTSPKMLKLIRNKNPKVNAKIMSAESLKFKQNTFDGITAFRFIMNFKPATRAKMLKEIHRVLKPGGIFLCNIHLNKWSPRGISGQLRNKFQNIGQPYMSHKEASRQLRKAGFKVKQVYGVKVIPFYRNKVFLPSMPLFWIEKVLGRSPGVKRLADGYVFVCTKDSK